MPSKDEIEQIAGFPEEKTKLGKTEQYFWEIRDIHRLGTRLNCFKYKLSLDDQLNDLKPVCFLFICLFIVFWFMVLDLYFNLWPGFFRM